MTKILVTGAAGFIGFHVIKKFLNLSSGSTLLPFERKVSEVFEKEASAVSSEGVISELFREELLEIVGIDNLNDYYDPQLKKDRLSELEQILSLQADEDRKIMFRFIKMDISEWERLERLFETEHFDFVIHLAAQAGIRYSLLKPELTVESNLLGFANMLECCRKYPVRHLTFASSSSVYGANRRIPFSEDDPVDHPLSLYGATKRANELMGHSYSHLFSIPMTGLRFFTVYGPWGRPDMAIYHFVDAVFREKPIDVYNFGQMKRDFTYIDDVAESVVRIAQKPPVADLSWEPDDQSPARSSAPFRLFNVGNRHSVPLGDLIQLIEKEVGKKAICRYKELQPGDVLETLADSKKLYDAIDFEPQTSLEQGIARFVSWYRNYYKTS